MSKKSIAFIAQKGAVYDTSHVAAGSHLGCRNADLITVAVCIFNRGSVDDAIEACPQCSAHAHGAWLACGVEGVSGQGELLEPPGCLADGPDFGVGAGIEFLGHRIQRAEQQLPGF